VAASADVRVSADVSGPVAIGVWRPIVLVPHRFLTLPVQARRAVLCHELLHVARRDWVTTVAGEVWCAVLWFHPAARALVSRLDLAREMLVDRLTIRATGDRRAYVQALLAFSDASPHPGAAGTPFTRPGYISQRIAGLVAVEVTMSRRSTLMWASVFAAVLTSVTIATAALLPMSPLSAAGRLGAGTAIVADLQEPLRPGPDVTLPRVVREVKPEYTREALQAGIQGSVTLTVVVKTDGMPGSIEITQSLDPEHGLDAAAVRALEQWRFEPGRKDGKAVPVQVDIEMTFTLK
jgi:TonB family protein